MTPEILAAYMKVMKESNLLVFRVSFGDVSLEGSFAPPPMPEFKGEALEPGGWKSPQHLDNVTEIE